MSIRSGDFNYIRDLVREHAAIVLDPGKEYLVESRLEPILRSEGFADFGKLVEHLQTFAGARLKIKVTEALTTNETFFFRDIYPFEALRDEVFPKLIERRRLERRLNIWCGASSTGQEPYTVAMLLKEAIPNLNGWTINFVASDLSTDVLDRARRGRYNQLEVARGLPPSYLNTYFKPVDGEWQVCEELRRMIDFRQINLKEEIRPTHTWDIVFMRNVLIYFDAETKTRILNRVAQQMRKDGYLFLGAAETTAFLTEAFQRVAVGKTTCYQPG